MKKHLLENLKKNQSNKIGVIIDEALAISQRYNNLLKKQY